MVDNKRLQFLLTVYNKRKNYSQCCNKKIVWKERNQTILINTLILIVYHVFLLVSFSKLLLLFNWNKPLNCFPRIKCETLITFILLISNDILYSSTDLIRPKFACATVCELGIHLGKDSFFIFSGCIKAALSLIMVMSD